MKCQWKMLALAAAFVPFIAVAGEAQPEGSLFKTLDTDMNGSISAEEAANNEMLTKEWSKLDADNSGGLEEAEFARFEEMQKPAEAAAKEMAKEMPKGMK